MYYAVINQYAPRGQDSICGYVSSIHIDKVTAQGKMAGLANAQRMLSGPDSVPRGLAVATLLNHKAKGDYVLPRDLCVVCTMNIHEDSREG